MHIVRVFLQTFRYYNFIQIYIKLNFHPQNTVNMYLYIIFMELQRKIIHIDMDAFFASVEQRDNPKYRGRAVAVGGKGRRGVVSAASYEARKYGVRSAMSSKIALMKCPHLIFAKPRFEVYKAVSKQIKDIFFDYTDLVEPLSFDEAFLDVTQNKINLPSATLIAKQIKTRIKNELNLTASAGVSFNKFLAKIASDYDKPDGFYLITPEDAEKFVEELPIENFFGVGKVTAKKMHRNNIFFGKDLKEFQESELIRLFGKNGRYYYQISRAVDNRTVNPNRIRKSIGAERTFDEDISETDEIKRRINKIAVILSERCMKSETYGRTLTLKVKYSDFKQVTRGKTVAYKIDTLEEIIILAYELIDMVDFEYNSIRLLGLSVTNLYNYEDSRPIQLSFDF